MHDRIESTINNYRCVGPSPKDFEMKGRKKTQAMHVSRNYFMYYWNS